MILFIYCGAVGLVMTLWTIRDEIKHQRSVRMQQAFLVDPELLIPTFKG